MCTLQSGPTSQNAHKTLKGVKKGTSFAKWGKQKEFLLNGIIVVTNVKLEGKKRNLLLSKEVFVYVFSP